MTANLSSTFGLQAYDRFVQALCQFNNERILPRLSGLSGYAPVISLWSNFKVKDSLHDGLLQILCSNTNL